MQQTNELNNRALTVNPNAFTRSLLKIRMPKIPSYVTRLIQNYAFIYCIYCLVNGLSVCSQSQHIRFTHSSTHIHCMESVLQTYFQTGNHLSLLLKPKETAHKFRQLFSKGIKAYNLEVATMAKQIVHNLIETNTVNNSATLNIFNLSRSKWFEE